jgi:hypothetical protein
MKAAGDSFGQPNLSSLVCFAGGFSDGDRAAEHAPPIRRRAGRTDEEGSGILDRHGRVDNPSATSADRLDCLVTPAQTRAVGKLGGNSGLPNDWGDTLLNMADNGRTEEEPLLLSIAGYQVLAYKGTNGIRLAAWKHRTRVTDGGVPVEYPIQEPSPQIAAQRFQTVAELEDAVLKILRVLQILRPTWQAR